MLKFSRIRHSRNRERWHTEIESLDKLSTFLARGGQPPPSPAWVEPSRRLLEDLVSKSQPNSVERDSFLRDLITEHAQRSALTEVPAVLSCLGLFQHTTAVAYLVGLGSLEPERYLRCILIGRLLRSSLVQESEAQVLSALLSVADKPRNDIETFTRLLQIVAGRTHTTYFTIEVIQRALTRFDVARDLKVKLEELTEQGHLSSLRDLVSSVRSAQAATRSPEVLRLLNEYLPAWAYLQAWRPVDDRIDAWEHGSFTPDQRTKLLPWFRLDGPDTATHTQCSLRLSDPSSFGGVYVLSPQTATTERLLKLLHHAQLVGQEAVELFIYLCVDSNCDEGAITLIEQCIDTEDDSFCLSVLSLRQASSTRLGLDRRMRWVINGLQALSSSAIDPELAFEDRLESIVDMWKDAQKKILAQLSSRLTGEYLGQRMCELGIAMRDTPVLHKLLPGWMLDQLKSMPTRDVLEAVFRQIENASNPMNSRFRSFLECSLGGQTSQAVGPTTVESIGVETSFWNQRPDAAQRDLAGIIGRVKSLEYSWYTQCLTQMVRENGLYIEEMTHMIQPKVAEACTQFANYLRTRRGLLQLRDECWLLLLAALIEDHVKYHNRGYFEATARNMTYAHWVDYTETLKVLMGSSRSRLPEVGYGLTRSRMNWWDRLASSPGVVFILQHQRGQKQFVWMYTLGASTVEMSGFEDLLNILDDQSQITPLVREIVARMQNDGSNWVLVNECIQTLQNQTISDFSVRLCETYIARQKEGWSNEGLAVLAQSWAPTIPEQFTRVVFGGNIPGQLGDAAKRSTATNLLASYNKLIGRARKLEALRIRLRRHNPARTADLLNRIGIDNPDGARVANDDVDDDLIDAVETISDDEIEMSFPLTVLGDLQKRAKGIPVSSRLFVVRLRLQRTSRRRSFCLHFSPKDDGTTNHHYWDAAGAEPTHRVCNATLNLFTFFVSRNLHRVLKNSRASGRALLLRIHSTVEELVNRSPRTCIIGPHRMTTKLWKPAACTHDCSAEFAQNSPLEVLLHNLLADSLAIDVLLTSIYAAATDAGPLELLPGCPVLRDQLVPVLDSMPPLETLQAATDLRAAIRGRDQYGVDREKLLSWLCLTFRGFMVSAPDGYRIPNMGKSKQFVLVNSSHEREAAYQAATGAHLNSGVAFHGTSASRLFCVLTKGLQVMRGVGVTNGAAYGEGIYLGDEQATSFGFAGTTGRSWSHSSLGNMKVMLGCELAAYGRSRYHPIHVISDESRVLVRYVFFIPQDYVCPPRHHVEPAMLRAFALLRSGSA